LAATGAPEAIARAARQYKTADNMTDRSAKTARTCRSACRTARMSSAACWY
jgi:hypothetical protein